jgi:hypothetical protein
MSLPLIELLYAALNSEHGVVVATDDAVRLRSKLYPLRKSDPDLACLSFTLSPTNPSGELWILKNGQV